MKQQPIFIVSTGRCGSTLLSNILNRNSEILSLSEFFVSLSPYAFCKEKLDGLEFWEILANPRPKATQMLRYKIGIPEFLYSAESGVPPLLLMTLPHITTNPDDLFLEVKEFVLQLHTDSIANHYLRLFSWFCKRFEKKIWIERSGGSLRFVPELLKLFPNAKFIHLYRDGRECAMSMSRHNAFRLTVIQSMVKELTGIDPYISEVPPESLHKLGPLTKLLPYQFDVSVYHDYDIPIQEFGRLWSSQILTGIYNLKKVPGGNVLNICYEDILNHPKEQINKLMGYIIPGFKDDIFVESASKLVLTGKKPSWIHLNEKDQKDLTRQCILGLKLLKYN